MRSQYFTFDGKKSQELGYLSARVGEMDADYELLGDRSIDTTPLSNKAVEFINGIEKKPIVFTLQIIPDNERQWTEEMYSQVCEWLIHDEYKEFISEDNSGKVHYVIATGVTTWKGVFQYGYIEVEFQTNANHAWTHTQNLEFTISGEEIIEITNKQNVGDRMYRPIIQCKKLNGAGDISISNLSNSGLETVLSHLNDNEEFTMDNEYRLFHSPTPTNYYGEHFNRNWVELVEGVNRLKIKGDCQLVFKCQFPIV